MRPRRQRPGAHRVSHVHSINTSEIRYPGHDLPELPEDPDERQPAPSEPSDGPSRLAPARDTGIALDTRGARARRSRKRSQQQGAIIGAVMLAAVLLLAIGWRAASDKRAVTAPLGGSAAAAVTSGSIGTAKPLVSLTATPPAVQAKKHYPTPIFASYKSMLIRLPVPIKSLTEVGFHQASYGYALPMKTPLADASLSQAAKYQSTRRDLSKQLTGPDAVLVGKVLRMWRARPGRPDTAADVGAKPGTAILAPVSGTVIKVKSYKLYNRYPDYEIHIQPTGRPKLDVVLIHVKGLTCHVGDKVVGGITSIGHIRKFSDKFHDQLASYSKGSGDHVHMEVNDATDPTYKGLVGAIDPKTWHRGDATPSADATGTAGSSAGDDDAQSGE